MMESLDTSYFRNRDGWNGKTTLDYKDTQVLVISTYKFRNGLRTFVSCHTRGDGTSLVHKMDMGTGLGDFHETVMVSHPNRVTEKLVIAQHKATLANLVRIRAQVEQFYLRQSALKVANRQDNCVAA